MAVLFFHNGSTKVVDAKVGANVWRILNGEIEPTEEQEKYIQNIKKVFLSWRKAPDSYIKQHFDVIAKQVIGHWMVEAYKKGSITVSDGVPSHPEPSDIVMKDFCEKWGLTAGGIATALARKYF